MQQKMKTMKKLRHQENKSMKENMKLRKGKMEKKENEN